MCRLRTHPGEVLREEYLKPLELSARALANSLGVPANRITEIMRGERRHGDSACALLPHRPALLAQSASRV